MGSIVLAPRGLGNGLTQAQAVGIANGGPISKVLNKKDLEVFMSFHNLTDPETIMKGRILSNKEFDSRLVLSGIWESESDAYPAWTGTAVAFKGEGAKLGDVVKYKDASTNTTHIFPVPKEYQNETNAILAVNHDFLPDGRPAFSFQQDGRDILIEVADNSRIALLRNFPGQNGWYLAENEFRIPIRTDTKGMPCSIPPKPEGPFVRHLHREAKGGGAGGYAGLLGRNGYRSFNRHVLAAAEPSSPFGALLDSEGIAKAGLRQSGSQ